jgi:hypothetical protein
MTLIETINRLDKMILDRASISEQRAIINSIRETLEAYDKDAADRTAIKESHAAAVATMSAEKAKVDAELLKAQAENAALKNPPPRNWGGQPPLGGRMDR